MELNLELYRVLLIILSSWKNIRVLFPFASWHSSCSFFLWIQRSRLSLSWTVWKKGDSNTVTVKSKCLSSTKSWRGFAVQLLWVGSTCPLSYCVRGRAPHTESPQRTCRGCVAYTSCSGLPALQHFPCIRISILRFFMLARLAFPSSLVLAVLREAPFWTAQNPAVLTLAWDKLPPTWTFVSGSVVRMQSRHNIVDFISQLLSKLRSSATSSLLFLHCVDSMNRMLSFPFLPLSFLWVRSIDRGGGMKPAILQCIILKNRLWLVRILHAAFLNTE